MASGVGRVGWWDLLCWLAETMLLPCILPWRLRFHEAHHDEAYNIVMGTILCPKDATPDNNKPKLCFQKVGSSEPPLLLLDLPLGPCDLQGACRVTLRRATFHSGADPLLAAHTWSVCCNGRKVGFGRRRAATEGDTWALEAVRAVSTGAGFLPARPGAGAFMYLRGRFQRVVGSADSESYHLVDPTGCLGPELSFFFVRD